MTAGRSGSWCFHARREELVVSSAEEQAAPTLMEARHAGALARLIPILGCGEEAALACI